MNSSLRTLLSVVLVLAGGYGLWVGVVAIESPPPTAPPRELGPTPVGVQVVEPRDLTLELDAFGNLEPRRRATLSAEIGGRIVDVYAGWRPGAIVEEGELLIALDPALYRLDLEAARAAEKEAEAAIASAEVERSRAGRQLENAREAAEVAVREHERAVALGVVATDTYRDTSLRAKLAAETAVDAATSAVEAADAALASANARHATTLVARTRATETLARTEIRAPFRGRLRGQAPGIGVLATPGAPLGELLDPSSLVLSVKIPERDLPLVRTGMSARVVFPSTPETTAGASYAATVVAVDAASDPVTRRGVVELELAMVEAESDVLPSGLFARASISLADLRDAIWIDRRHFVWRDGEPIAFVRARGADGMEAFTAERRVLSLAREYGEGFLVEDGLAAGDVLIVHPLDRLDDGVEVRVLEERGGPR